jgi:hypothetical protein
VVLGRGASLSVVDSQSHENIVSGRKSGISGRFRNKPAGVMDEQDRYDWKKSQLHSRVMQQAAQSMASRYFSVPPKEFMFISRKFIGAYTFMTVIEAKTNVRKMIRQFA